MSWWDDNGTLLLSIVIPTTVILGCCTCCCMVFQWLVMAALAGLANSDEGVALSSSNKYFSIGAYFCSVYLGFMSVVMFLLSIVFLPIGVGLLIFLCWFPLYVIPFFLLIKIYVKSAVGLNQANVEKLENEDVKKIIDEMRELPLKENILGTYQIDCWNHGGEVRGRGRSGGGVTSGIKTFSFRGIDYKIRVTKWRDETEDYDAGEEWRFLSIEGVEVSTREIKDRLSELKKRVKDEVSKRDEEYEVNFVKTDKKLLFEPLESKEMIVIKDKSKEKLSDTDRIFWDGCGATKTSRILCILGLFNIYKSFVWSIPFDSIVVKKVIEEIELVGPLSEMEEEEDAIVIDIVPEEDSSGDSESSEEI